MRNLLISALSAIIDNQKQLVCLGADEKKLFVDGKATDKIDSVVLKAVGETLGEVQIVFQPQDGLVDQLNRKVPFGSPFLLSNIGDVADVRIGIYNNNLTIKILMQTEVTL